MDFFKLRKETQLAAWLLLGFAGCLIYDQIHYWLTKEDYLFGFLVPLFVGYVLFERWPLIKQSLLGSQQGARHSSGAMWAHQLTSVAFGGVILASLASFALGAMLRVSGPGSLASLLIACGFAGICLATVYFHTDRDVFGQKLSWQERIRTTLLFLFPALAWLISAPLVMVIESDVKRILLGYVTPIVFHIFNFLGYTIIQEGNVLVLPEGKVHVEDACSGIRSLTACIFAGTFIAAVFLQQFWKKVLLVVTAMLFAFITNVGRSLFLTGWGFAYGPEAIDQVHDIAGFAVIGITCLMLITLLPLFNFSIAPDDLADDDTDTL